MSRILEDANDALRRALPERIATELIEAIKVGVQLVSNPTEDNYTTLGSSKLGGLPDMPQGRGWPKWKERSLSFIAQINLEDLQSSICKACLPAKGMLYFFYDPEQETWGFDPNDKGSWAVIYADSKGDLVRTEAPGDLPDYGVYSPSNLSAQEVVTYPPIDSPEFRSLNPSDAEIDAYADFLESEEQKRDSSHQLLGHPSTIQEDMRLECQLVSHGLYCGDSTGYESPAAKELEAGSLGWQLLLQIDSDDGSEMTWGDCGRLYFWITKDALANNRFDLAWMVLQCS